MIQLQISYIIELNEIRALDIMFWVTFVWLKLKDWKYAQRIKMKNYALNARYIY